MMVTDYWVWTEIAAILVGLFGLAVSFITRGMKKWPGRWCIAIFSAAVLSAALSLMKGAAFQNQAPLFTCRALLLFTSLIAPVPSLLMTVFFLFYCGENWRESAIWYVQLTLSVLLASVALIGQLTGVIGITPDYEIYSGYWTIVRIPLIAACVVANMVALLRRRKKLGRVQKVMFLVCFFSLDYILIILMELLLISELVRRYLEQAQEAARQRMRNAIAQMRPHFIHNTMMTIYYLCEKNPRKAQAVTLNFANYLQSNFLAIVREGTIPFTEELEHTSAYLEVEQARFSGQLFVEFDTPVTFFEIPPLTLQPLVENAIKHGLDPDLDPLYVSILTRETEKDHEIIVEDTGPGFVPAGDDDPYITLNNIRERLKTMCQGTLEIEPRKAGGTKVTIRIPMKKQQSI